jgi:two-component system cell cycle sensor histidine kinase/response regulator CckA
MKDRQKTKKQPDEESKVLRNQLVEPKNRKIKRKPVKKTQQESEETFRALAENANDGIFVTIGEGLQAYANKRASEITGYSVAELIKTTIKDLVHPDELKKIMERYRKRLAGEPIPIQYETIIIRKDGKSIPIELTASKTVWQGQPAVLVIIRNITERKQSEETLRESEERFRMVLESSMDNLYRRNLKTDTYDYMSPAVERILGYSPEEILSMPLESVVSIMHPDDADTVKRVIGESMTSDRSAYLLEYRFRHKDGQYRWLSDLFTVVRDAQGRPLYFVGNVRDITERKRAEEALRESEERFRLAFENANTGVCLVDLEGNLTKVNNRMCEIFGYTKEELEHMTVNDIAHPEDIDKSPMFIQRTLRGETDRGTFEKRYLHKKGHVVTCQVSSSLVRNADGFPLYFISHVHDITERKQAEARTEHLKFVLLAIRGVNQLITREKDRDRLIQDACDKLIEMRGYDNVWIALIDESGKVAATAEAGLGKRFLPLVEQLERSEPPYCMRMALTQAGVLIIEDPFATCDDCPLSNGYGGRRAMATRLEHGGKIYGLITVSVSEDYAADEEEQTLFAEVAEDVAFALYSIELEEKRGQAEAAVRESEERFRTVVETMKVGLSAIDEKGVLTYVNEYFSTMLGYTIDEMIGRSTLDFYYDKESRKTQEEIFAKRRAGMRDPTPYEVTWRKKDGQKVYSILSPTPSFDANGRYTGSFAIHTDITERKRAEELLQKEREISLSILENAPYGVALIDKDGQYIYINPESTNITGYTLEDIPTGKDWFRKAFPDPKDRERIIQVWKEDRSKGNMMIREFSIICKDGKIKEIEIRSTFLQDGRSVIVLHDITEQKRAEEKMESLQEQLRQSQKMEAIGRLAGGIAHDFNNLLTIIKGYSQLSLIELKEDSPLKKNIEHIHGATDRAANLVRQLLAFSRRQILEMKVLNLNAILTNLDNMLRRVIGEDIELITILAEDLGRVKTDPGWIEQAIMNLVVNSRDAMPSGGKLTIETGNADLDEASTFGHVGVEPGRYVMLSVSDTGVGITPEVMERLFEPFFSTKEKDKGTGLGLSTVYGIVKQSDGDIWVYSEPGKGATFKIYLPRVDEPLEERRVKVLSDELLRGSETILLVEDEENVRKLALRVLERQGYKVLSARDGDDALLICEQFKDPIHLMLTDVVMPGMSGHELAKRLKSLHPKMKVLYMSGYTDDTIVLHGVLVEGVNYIQKPFTVDALTKKVREVLEQ